MIYDVPILFNLVLFFCFFGSFFLSYPFHSLPFVHPERHFFRHIFHEHLSLFFKKKTLPVMSTSKKIIAICQSGGEFVTNKDGSLAYNGGEAYAVDIDEHTQLGDFKKEVAEMFDCRAETMSIKYFLPGNRQTLITVSKDKDLKRMVNFLGDSVTVDVFIMSEEVAARNVSTMPASRSSRTTVPETVADAVPPVDAFVDNALANDTIDFDINNETPLASIPFGEDRHHRAALQWENIITGVDQRFNSFNEFREALHKYSIAHGFAYRYKKNDSHRVSAKCKAQGCPWRVYASKLSTTQLICIKKMNPTHTCEGAVVKAGYRATKGWVGSIIKEKLKVSPNYKPKDIVDDIKREYGIQMNYSQAWRAKELARESIQGSYTDAYSQLPHFCEKILETNPGSFATFTTKDDTSFHRFFVSFQASVSGFKQGCRPLIFLNSTPLNSKYQGILLAATAVDGDDGVFPVAFAVVDDETDDNWRWFLLELRAALAESRRITFVADLLKGLKESLAEIFKDGYHSFCLQFLAEKLNKDLKGHFSHEARRLMVQDFYATAHALTPEAFERCSENIKAISLEAFNWVMQSEPDHWATAYFKGERYNFVTSNFGQQFYSWILEEKELPITHLVNVLRGKMMEFFYTRRLDSSQWVTRLTPSKEEALQRETLEAQSLQVLLSQGSTFEVRGESVDIVDIDHWDCTCQGWHLTGLPCCHAIAVLNCTGRSPYDYCSRYFTAESYCLTYSESIHPVPSVDWQVQSDSNQPIVLVTPPAKRPPGRPKIKAHGSIDFIKRQLQCSKCKGLGHNKKTCRVS